MTGDAKEDRTARPVVIVTGGSRGLGREVVLRFARGGWNVVVNYARSEEKARATAEEARIAGRDAGEVARPSWPCSTADGVARPSRPCPSTGETPVIREEDRITGKMPVSQDGDRITGRMPVPQTSVPQNMPEVDAAVVQADVGDLSSHERLIGAAMERWGRLDCLVNNAAVMSNILLASMSAADWDAEMRVDLAGPMALARRAAAAMGPGGSIVNVISICGLWGCAGACAYSAAKGALGGFTAGMAPELAARGIRINAITPGYMATDMGLAAPRAMEIARSRHAMNELSDPRGGAEFIFRLAAELRVSGQVFTLEGRIR